MSLDIQRTLLIVELKMNHLAPRYIAAHPKCLNLNVKRRRRDGSKWKPAAGKSRSGRLVRQGAYETLLM